MLEAWKDRPRLPARRPGNSWLAQRTRFDVAIVGLFACLLLLTVWILVDACFRSGPEVWTAMLDLDTKEPVGAVIWYPGVDVRSKILFEPDGSLSRNGWIRRGWSVVALMSLAVTFGAVVLTGLVSHCRSSFRWATVLTGVAWAVALYLSYDWLLWTGARWRLPRDLTRFQQVGRQLAAQWPALPDGKTSGRVAVPGLREVLTRTNGRPKLFVFDDFRQLPRREGFGLRIEREDDPEIIRIELTSGYWLEYHVTGSAPKAYPTGEESKNVPKRVARVDENWYLVEYESVRSTAQSND